MRGAQITLLVGLLGWWTVAEVCAQTLTDSEQEMLEVLWQTGIDFLLETLSTNIAFKGSRFFVSKKMSCQTTFPFETISTNFASKGSGVLVSNKVFSHSILAFETISTSFAFKGSGVLVSNKMLC